ncbi:MAG: hypothetical protein K9W44_08645 [Candidatus Lokiarchaeota archaeon]|nr:hypothetical protein [Candidatus Harpocratesius repetitus]
MAEKFFFRSLRFFIIGVTLISFFGAFIPFNNINSFYTPDNTYNYENSENTISNSPNSAQDYKRIGQILFAQSLGDVTGLSVAGINTREGDTNTTDMIIVGTTGMASWRGLQGYYTNESTSLNKLQNDNDDAVTGIITYVDPQDQNTKIIYSTQGTDTGTLVRQEAANPIYSTAPTVEDNGKSTFVDTPLISLCKGNFDDDDELEVAALGTNGKIVGLMNLQTPNQGSTFFQFSDGAADLDYRKFHTCIIPISNIDNHGTEHDDIIAGYDNFIAAISTNFSANALIWQTDIKSDVGGITVISDMTNDGIPEVLATSRAGIYLLNGSNGVLIWNATNIGSTFRDLVVFNDITGDGFPEVITGNWEGDILFFDVCLNSTTFGMLVANTTLPGGQITRFLQLDDITGDGIPDYAVGGTGMTGVLYGNNFTWYWKNSVSGSGYWLNPFAIKIYDMTLMADQNGDGIRDFAVVGGYETLDSGAFIFNCKGILTPTSNDDTATDDSTTDDTSIDNDDVNDDSQPSPSITIAGSFEFLGLAVVFGYFILYLYVYHCHRYHRLN